MYMYIQSLVLLKGGWDIILKYMYIKIWFIVGNPRSVFLLMQDRPWISNDEYDYTILYIVWIWHKTKCVTREILIVVWSSIYHLYTTDIITTLPINRATPDDEIIPYKREGSGSLVIQESMADVAVGGEFDWSTGTLINRRYYAIKAILAPGEACLSIKMIDRTIWYFLLF